MHESWNSSTDRRGAIAAGSLSSIPRVLTESDLLVFLHGARFGFEFKYADAPAVTKSLQTAHDDLKIHRAFVVHPGTKTYALNAWCEAVAMGDLRARTQQIGDET